MPHGKNVGVKKGLTAPIVTLESCDNPSYMPIGMYSYVYHCDGIPNPGQSRHFFDFPPVSKRLAFSAARTGHRRTIAALLTSDPGHSRPIYNRSL